MIADKLVELKILLRRACMCENAGVNKKSTIHLRTKVLYLLKERPVKASELIGTLSVAKPNVTALTNGLAADGLITKERSSNDRREITLTITEAGSAFLRERLDIIESGFKNILTSEEEYSAAEEDIDAVINLLSFLG